MISTLAYIATGAMLALTATAINLIINCSPVAVVAALIIWLPVYGQIWYHVMKGNIK